MVERLKSNCRWNGKRLMESGQKCWSKAKRRRSTSGRERRSKGGRCPLSHIQIIFIYFFYLRILWFNGKIFYMPLMNLNWNITFPRVKLFSCSTTERERHRKKQNMERIITNTNNHIIKYLNSVGRQKKR